MNNFIFNLRVWAIHFQIFKGINIRPLFKWFDFWVGLFIDTKKNIYYLFPIPMFGIKITGIRIHYNKHYKFKEHPFIHLFNFGEKYWPLTEHKKFLEENPEFKEIIRRNSINIES